MGDEDEEIPLSPTSPEECNASNESLSSKSSTSTQNEEEKPALDPNTTDNLAPPNPNNSTLNESDLSYEDFCDADFLKNPFYEQLDTEFWTEVRPPMENTH